MEGLGKRKDTTIDKEIKNTTPTKPNVEVLHAAGRGGLPRFYSTQALLKAWSNDEQGLG